MGKKKFKDDVLTDKKQIELREAWDKFFMDPINNPMPTSSSDEEEPEEEEFLSLDEVQKELTDAVVQVVRPATVDKENLQIQIETKSRPKGDVDDELMDALREQEPIRYSEIVRNEENMDDSQEPELEDNNNDTEVVGEVSSRDFISDFEDTEDVDLLSESNMKEIQNFYYTAIKMATGTILLGDRERMITLDAAELETSESSDHVTDDQIKETMLFFIINCRPDAIITVDSFIKKIANRYESIDTDRFIFIKDNSLIYCYDLGTEFVEKWESITQELKEAGTLYDFLNTVAKKSSSKHYRMKHTKAFTKFWIDEMNWRSEDVNVMKDEDLFLSSVKEDLLGTEDRDQIPFKTSDQLMKEFKVIDYWEFFQSFRDKFFSKCSDEKEMEMPVKEIPISEQMKAQGYTKLEPGETLGTPSAKPMNTFRKLTDEEPDAPAGVPTAKSEDELLPLKEVTPEPITLTISEEADEPSLEDEEYPQPLVFNVRRKH